MKKTLKILIPLVLVIALLAAACWFFLFYRPDIATGFLLGQADSMVQKGRYERAVTYYSWAWALEPDRDDIPVELAQTYIAGGNYTKAEYTLVKAISNHPGKTDLYVALCRTYVEQNKLLDAVQMLDRTTDASVKAELDALRPAAPVISPESGYYTEHIEISVEADAATIYTTTDGEYPSSGSDLYGSPITLPAGETTVLALAVSEQGLVSPVSLNGYTIGGVVEEVTLQDAAVDAAIREQLGMSSEDVLMSDLLWSITHLTLPDTVEDLSDLVHFTGLQSLTVQNISGMDFSILQQLPALQELNLSGCTISSNALEAIGSLTELRKLVLDSCALTDITAFSQLTKLTEIQLSGNSLQDIGVLSLMPELETVGLANNPLTSIAGLSACSKLKYVDITGCSVGSVGSLSGKSELETLKASGNEITDLKELSACKKLAYLDVSDNFIADISVLTALPKLTYFDGDQNQITAVPDFDEDDCILVYFSIDYNQVEDISGLAGIDTLNRVNIDYNKVKDLTPLADNINLVQVNAWDNAITEESLEALNAHSIIVNYNPNYEDPDAEEETEE